MVQRERFVCPRARQAIGYRCITRRKIHHGAGFSDQLARKIAGRLNSAKSPAVIVGGDVERAGACTALITLAERLRAPVWSAPLPGLSGFPENYPLYPGVEFVEWLHIAILSMRSRKALPITETELRLIAAAAIIGERSSPKNGYKAPAAIGMPMALYTNAKTKF
jgi:hypothetical protein